MAVKKICVFPGDGIGPEVVREGLSVLRTLEEVAGRKMFETEEELLGGASYDVHGVPMAPNALALAKQFRLKAVIAGGVEAWKAAADLAAAKARDKANALPRPIIWPAD